MQQPARVSSRLTSDDGPVPHAGVVDDPHVPHDRRGGRHEGGGHREAALLVKVHHRPVLQIWYGYDINTIVSFRVATVSATRSMCNGADTPLQVRYVRGGFQTDVLAEFGDRGRCCYAHFMLEEPRCNEWDLLGVARFIRPPYRTSRCVTLLSY